MNEGCRSQNGSIIGVIHQMFIVDGGNDTLITDMLVSTGDDLTERKRLLLDNGDCVLVLPGGIGTFDEMVETISSKSLKFRGLTSVPICILNIDGYYDGFITQLKRAEQDGMLYDNFNSYVHVETCPKAAVAWVESELQRNDWVSSRLNRNKLRSTMEAAQAVSGENGRVALR